MKAFPQPARAPRPGRRSRGKEAVEVPLVVLADAARVEVQSKHEQEGQGEHDARDDQRRFILQQPAQQKTEEYPCDDQNS